MSVMGEGSYLPKVRTQYERYPYPPRRPADERKTLIRTDLDYLAKINHYGFRGRQRFDGFRALVVGGGTGDATVFLAEQLRRKDAEVVHLDISRASLDIARRRAEVRGLTRIQWVNRSLLELPILDLGRFDYINCCGVLHHLADPKAGLAALKSVLAPGGCMGLMLYATYGRTAIYQIQELMRRVNEGEPDIGVRVENTRTMIDCLPETNWIKRGGYRYKDMERYGDAGIHDMFLHSQDRSYTVEEMYALVEGAGLRFIDFSNHRTRREYRPGTYLRNPRLLRSLRRLPIRRQQAIGELMAGHIMQHSFYVSEREQTVADLDDLDNVPYHFYAPPANLYETMTANPKGRVNVTFSGGLGLSFQPGPRTRFIFKYLDGRASLGEIFARVREETGEPFTDRELLAEFGPIYEILKPYDWILMRHRSVSPLPCMGDGEIVGTEEGRRGAIPAPPVGTRP